MWAITDAKAALHTELERRYQEPDDELVIVEDRTIERPFGWVFFYNSSRYRSTRESKYAIAGNGPVIVNKITRQIKFCPATKPVEQWIADYEMSLKAEGPI